MASFNDIGSIVADANYITEKALLPLSSVKTEKDKERYKKKGYLPGYTYSEWKTAYPFIPADKVYYLNGINVGTIYYDKKHLVYIALGIYDRQVVYPGNAEDYKRGITEAIKSQEIKSSKKKYVSLFLTMPDGIKMDAMSHLLELEGPTPVFYERFMIEYTTANFICKNLPKRVLNAVEKSKSSEQKAKTQDALQPLFGDKDFITVYRGESDGSTNYREAMSWTPNINVAHFFATRFGKKPIIRTGRLYRKDVLEYFPVTGDIGSEEEILVMPGKVKNVSSTELLGIESREIKRVMGEAIRVYKTWSDDIVNLYDSMPDSNAHDVMHTLRVALLSCYIGALEGLSDVKLFKLCEAAMYHDAGRKSDGIENGHGEASAEIYKDEGGRDPYIEFAVRMHCVDDKICEERVRNEFSEKEQADAMQILNILKDADALDRVRFGMALEPGQDGLDVNYLRFDFSKRLTPLAMQCLRFLKKPE